MARARRLLSADSLNRLGRTVVRVAIALAAAIPIAASQIPGVDVDKAAKIGGIFLALATVITAAHNALEDRGHLRLLRPRGDVNRDRA